MSLDNEIKHEIVKAPIFRRIGAFITDIFIVLFLFLIFNTYVFSPIFANVFSYQENVIRYQEIMVDSNLYYEDAQGNVDEIINEFANGDFKSSELSFYKKVDNCIESFYLKYHQDGLEIIDYYKSKESSTLYDYINNVYVLKNDVDIELYKDFIIDEYDIALNLFSKVDVEYIEIARELTIFQVVTALSALTISYALTYLIIPLFIKNGETIGKKLLAIGIVSAKDGFAIKKSQILIRFLVIFFIEVLASIMLFGIPMILSFTMLIFNKNGLAVHDYLSATICVDKKQTLIFKDFDEFIKHEQINLK